MKESNFFPNDTHFCESRNKFPKLLNYSLPPKKIQILDQPRLKLSFYSRFCGRFTTVSGTHTDTRIVMRGERGWYPRIARNKVIFWCIILPLLHQIIMKTLYFSLFSLTFYRLTPIGHAHNYILILTYTLTLPWTTSPSHVSNIKVNTYWIHTRFVKKQSSCLVIYNHKRPIFRPTFYNILHARITKVFHWDCLFGPHYIIYLLPVVER